MPTIGTPRVGCTVIVTVDADPAAMPDLVSHARFGLERFGDFEGFVGGALHQSEDGRRLVQYLQWEREADHRACIDDPQWDALPSTKRFMELVQSGQAKMDVRTYEVLATTR